MFAITLGNDEGQYQDESCSQSVEETRSQQLFGQNVDYDNQLIKYPMKAFLKWF